MASHFLSIYIGLALIVIPTAAQKPSLPPLDTITIASKTFAVDPQNIVLHGTTVSAGGPAIIVDGQSVSADEADDLFMNSAEVLSHPTNNVTPSSINELVASTTLGTSTISQPPSVSKAAITSSGISNSTYFMNKNSSSHFARNSPRSHSMQTNSTTTSPATSILVLTTSTGSSTQALSVMPISSASSGTLVFPNNVTFPLAAGVDQGSSLQTSARSSLSISTSVSPIPSDWKSLNPKITSPASLIHSPPTFASPSVRSATSSAKANSTTITTVVTTAATSASSASAGEISDAIVLGAALMQLSSSASRAGSNILQQPTKDAFSQSIESLKSKLKDLGGIDVSGSCASLKKRRGRWQRNLLSDILNALSNSCGSLVTIGNMLKGNTPNLAAIDQQWTIIEVSAKVLQSGEDSGDNDDDDDDDDDEKETQSSNVERPTKSAESQESKASSKSSRTVSSSAPSQTSTRRSSSTSQTASAPGKVGCYSGTEYAYPASYSAPASATNAIFGVLSLALLGHMGAYVPDVTTSIFNATANATSRATYLTETSTTSSVPASASAAVSLPTPKPNNTKDFAPAQSVLPKTKTAVPTSTGTAADVLAQEIAYQIANLEAIASSRALISNSVRTSIAADATTVAVGAATIAAIAAQSASSSVALAAAVAPPLSTLLTSSIAPAPPKPLELVPPLMCTQLVEVLQGGRNPYYIHTCTCNDGSKPTAIRSGEVFACPSQVDVVLVA